MSNALIGAGGYVGFAEETTYGTPVTPSTAWLGLGLNSNTVGETRVRQTVGQLGTLSASPAHHNASRQVETAVEVGGNLDFVPHYAGYGFGFLLKHALGAVTTTGSGPYAHEYTLDRDGVIGFTLQSEHGQHPTVDSVQVGDGLRVDTLELSASAGEPVQCTVGLIGRSLGNMVASVSGTADFTSENEEILSHQSTDLSWNSGNHRCRNWTVRLENGLVRRDYVGSKYTDCPQPGGLAKITFRATVEWVANDLYDGFRAKTSGAGQLTLTGTGNNSMVIDLHGLTIQNVSKLVNSAGILVFEVEGQAFAHATIASRTGLTITVNNDNSGAIA